MALRAPEDVVRRRRERLEKTAKEKGRRVSEEQMSLCAWTVLATNLPKERFSADEIYTLYRVRWQMELVFKLWKSEGGVATSHGKTGLRCLCEFLAKLLGQIIANWFMLMRGGRLGEASVTKLYRQISRSIPDISDALWSRNEAAVEEALRKLWNRLQRVRPRKRRKKQPSTRQTLCENITYD